MIPQLLGTIRSLVAMSSDMVTVMRVLVALVIIVMLYEFWRLLRDGHNTGWW